MTCTHQWTGTLLTSLPPKNARRVCGLCGMIEQPPTRAEHTPLPWVMGKCENPDDGYYLRRDGADSGESDVAWIQPGNPHSPNTFHKDLRLILLAVNNHAKLVEALRAFLPFMSTEESMLNYAATNGGRASDFDVASLKARALLAEIEKAEVRS